jgi:hypothetical protein
MPDKRSKMSKLRLLLILVVTIIVLGAALFVVHARWMTRTSELPGNYTARGVWGTSSLVLRPDHTFHQEVVFLNQYTGVAEGTKHVDGSWTAKDRTLFKQNLEFNPFISPSPLNNQVVFPSFQTSYALIGIGFGIEVDSGASIYYWKQE